MYRARILGGLTQVLADPTYGTAIRQDLVDGFSALPAWRQILVRELPGYDPQIAVTKTPHAVRREAASAPPP